MHSKRMVDINRGIPRPSDSPNIIIDTTIHMHQQQVSCQVWA